MNRLERNHVIPDGILFNLSLSTVLGIVKSFLINTSFVHSIFFPSPFILLLYSLNVDNIFLIQSRFFFSRSSVQMKKDCHADYADRIARAKKLQNLISRQSKRRIFPKMSLSSVKTMRFSLGDG